MNDYDWKKIDELLDAALDLKPKKRKAFLDKVCGNDYELRKKLEKLLTADEQAQSFIESPALLKHANLLSKDQELFERPFPFAFGRYQVLRKIGQGGMGKVYLAEDKSLSRKVALKILRTGLTNEPARLQRFQKEVRAASSLNHPNILTVYDTGQENGVPFIATEYVEGRTLRVQVSAGKIKISDAVEIAIQICSALAAAHESGIVHRDIKPENIMLRHDGIVKVLDFGVAKMIQTADSNEETKTNLTVEGEVIGTAKYMSPEQVRAQKVDARSDIFSLGIVLFEMLTGVAPFEGKTKNDVIAAILNTEILDISSYLPGIPKDLETIVIRMLQKDPQDRYQNDRELLKDLKQVKQSLDSSADTDKIQKASLHSPIPPQPVYSAKKRSLWPTIVLALLAVSVVVLSILLLHKKQIASAPQKIERSIAVLPFSNMNIDKEDEYFSDGITEDIITHLSKVGHLKVISRTSSMRYKNSNKSLQQIGKELKVASVLEGSVRRQGDKLRIVAQLIDVKTDNHIWAETYDRKMKDIFAIQSDVAQKIAFALKAELMPEEKKKIEQVPTKNLAAYDYYLKGRQYFLRYQAESNENAIQFFQKAVEADPHFVLAYVGLCDGYAMRKRYGVPDASFELALEECNKALSMDPNLAITYSTLHKVYSLYGFNQKAEDALQKAYELDPNNAIVVGRLGTDYQIKGNLVEAFRFTNRMLELDPTNAFPHFTLGSIYYQIADFNEAESYLKKSIELQPDFEFPYTYLVRLYISQGKFQQALESARVLNISDTKLMFDLMGLTEAMSGNYRKAVEYFPKGNRRLLEERFAHVLLKLGRREEGEQILDQTKQKTLETLKEGQKNSDLEYMAAMAFSMEGNIEASLKQLQRACDTGYWYYQFLERDPVFESMRNDPQYQKVIQSMKSKVAEARRELGI